MLIIPFVCAEFKNKSGETAFRIRPHMLKVFQEAPDEIKDDPLFEMLVRDGSIQIPESVEKKSKLENDPDAGMAASGKTVEAELTNAQEAEKEKSTEKPARSSKSAKAKAEENTAEVKSTEAPAKSK